MPLKIRINFNSIHLVVLYSPKVTPATFCERCNVSDITNRDGHKLIQWTFSKLFDSINKPTNQLQSLQLQ